MRERRGLLERLGNRAEARVGHPKNNDEKNKRNINKSMKRILIATAMMALAGVASTAQPKVKTDTTVTVEYSSDKYIVETAPFKANWFVGIDGGAQIYFGEHDKQCKFGDRLAPALNIYVGKWFTPTVGARIGYSGIGQKGATQDHTHGLDAEVPGKGGHGYWLYKQEFSFWNIHADAMFNLANAFCGYKPEGHVWNPTPFIGLGWAHVYSEEPKTNEITANAGLINAFRLCDALDLNVNVHAMMVNEAFDGETGHRWGEGNLSATVGLTYRFKPRGWQRSKIVKVVETSDVSSYQIALAELKAERERLEAELAALKTKPEVIETTNTIASPYYVRFELGKSELSKEARVNLGLLAEILKTTGAKFTVSGYADAATGNKKLNERLSQDRAQAVYDCLTKEFGVPASQLVIDYKGGVDNMFYDDPSLSRAVITRAAK